jgi:hypothetical protein
MLKQNLIKCFTNAKLYLAFVLAALLAVSPLSVGTLPVAHAATITVDSTTNVVADDGVCTVREAITAANTDTASGATAGECPAGVGADTIELDISLTYLLDVVDNSTEGENGLPSITSEITINGNGSTIQRDALAPDFRIFHLGVGGTLTLNDVTITGGVASGPLVSGQRGGGIYNNGAVTFSNSTFLTIVDSTISDNSAADGLRGNSASLTGGGIYILGSAIIINNSTISGNSAPSLQGGGIWNRGSFLTIVDSTISDNSAADGGGIWNRGSLATVTRSTISGNSATLVGGGIKHEGTDQLTVTDSTISGNSATDGGGRRYPQQRQT